MTLIPGADWTLLGSQARAKAVVGIFEMLGDVTDRLLRRCGLVRVLGFRDRFERSDQTAAENIGEPNELHYDRVRRRRLACRRGLGSDFGYAQEEKCKQCTTTH